MEVFEVARNAPRHSDGDFEDDNLHFNVAIALVEAGKLHLEELIDQIYLYVNDPSPELRMHAVTSLGWDTRLQVTNFCKNQAFNIWLKDPSEDVKTAALTAWAGYYSCDKSPKILKELYDIFISRSYSVYVRANALKSFFDVADAWVKRLEGIDILELGDLETQAEFEQAVDWGRVNKVMEDCVPGWKGKH